MVADAAAPTVTPAADAPAAPATPGRFHCLIIVEGIQTGDKRLFAEQSLTWRDLPLPLMAQDDNTPEHEGAMLIGNFDDIQRKGLEIHGYGAYLTEPGEEAARLIGLVQSGELRGVSADIDDVEFEVLFPTTDANGEPLPDMFMMLFDPEAEPPPTEVLDDGIEYEVMPIAQEVLRVTEGRVMGATVLTFPAFQEAYIEDDSGDVSLAASGPRIMTESHVTGVMLNGVGPLSAAGSLAPGRATGREGSPARFDFPEIPPREWFEVPETPGPMPLTILDSGQVFGHLAVWGECHIGLAGECVEPPPSTCNYARFHLGEIPVDDGGRVSVGKLTFGIGHADLKLNAEAARRHYDNSRAAAADLVASDGEYGIWVCGAARSTLTTADVREVMSCPPSGDWRRFGRNLELVAALSVVVPGFQTLRASARARREEGLIASLVVSHPAPPVGTPGLDPRLAHSLTARIAASIGRDPKSRIAALAARVHGGNH